MGALLIGQHMTQLFLVHSGCYCQRVLISLLHIIVGCSLSCLLFHTGANTITTAHLTGVNHLIYYNICLVHPFTTLPFIITILVSYIKNEWTVTEFFVWTVTKLIKRLLSMSTSWKYWGKRLHCYGNIQQIKVGVFWCKQYKYAWL